MNINHKNLEMIYEIAAGFREAEEPLFWVEAIQKDGSLYSAACQDLYEARNRLASRFSISPEDPDLEKIMTAAMTLEKEMALHMLRCGMICGRSCI